MDSGGGAYLVHKLSEGVSPCIRVRVQRRHGKNKQTAQPDRDRPASQEKPILFTQVSTLTIKEHPRVTPLSWFARVSFPIPA